MKQCPDCGLVMQANPGEWFCWRCLEFFDPVPGDGNALAFRMQDCVDDQAAADLAEQYEPVRSRHLDEEPVEDGE